MPDAYAGASSDARSKAVIRARAISRATALIAEGHSALRADTIAAEDAGVQRAAVMRWRKRAARAVSGGAAEVLLGGAGAGRPSAAWDTPGAGEAWRIWCADYLRPEEPGSMACWRRVRDLARPRGWTIPCERMFRIRLRRDVPIEVVTLKRRGIVETLKLFPDQVRTVAGMLPLDCVSGDGDRHAVFVEMSDGRVIRPVGWYWQDVRTRKILGWCIGETENQDLVRLAFVQMIDDYGVPRIVYIDNTRAASAKWWSADRKRGWKSDEEKVPGVMEELGIAVIRSHVETELNGKARGWGQAKPVERFFNDIAEGIDRHPLCAHAWAGRNPARKPANYGVAAVAWKTFLAVVADGVAEYNARPERRMEVARNGRSIDEVWAEEIAWTPVRTLSREQRALLLLACESTQVHRDGTFTLAAGKGTGLPANRYFHERLRALAVRLPANRKVIARFDPQDLHAGVEVYDLEMRWLCHAQCQLQVGFLDREGARQHNRARRQLLKATKAAAKAQERIQDVLEEYGAEPRTPAPGPAPKIAEIVAPERKAAVAADEAAREHTLTRFARAGLKAVNDG